MAQDREELLERLANVREALAIPSMTGEVGAYVASLFGLGALEGRLPAVANLAMHLAAMFDVEPTAAVARELRACLSEIAPTEDDEGDDLGALVARMSAEMGDTPRPE